jgi:calmodulin
MVDKFTDQQIEEMKEVYQRLFDRDNDGRLNKKDIEGGLIALGFKPSVKEVEDIIYELNTSKLGVLDFSEFLTGMSRTVGFVDEEAEIAEAFRLYDPYNSGFITADQLANTLAQIGENAEPDEIAELIKEADVDGDGKVSPAEFKRMLNKKQ